MTDLLNLAESVISKAKSMNIDYADVRTILTNSTTFQMHNSKFQSSIAGENFGIGVRVIHKGKQGFYSTNNVNGALDSIKFALELAKSNPSEKKISLAPAEIIKKEYTLPTKIPIKNISIDEKVELAMNATKAAQVGAIRAIDITYTDSFGDTIFVNTEGTHIIKHSSGTFLGFSATAKSGSKLETVRSRFGGSGFEKFSKAEEEIKEKAILANDLLKAKMPKAGIFDAVMDNESAGVFAHEAVGHACEADIILNDDSVLRGRIGEQIGSEHISITDSPAVEDEWGSYFYDEEGVPAQYNRLITNGVLKKYLQSRITAAEMKTASTGNARAQGFSFVPIVRMSNTFFEGGKFTNEELIEEIKNGYLLIGFKGGMVNTLNGEFNFACECAREIKNGKLGSLLNGCTFGGEILKTMHNIYGCGPFNKRMGIGWCGKSGQRVPAGDGACHVGVRKLKIGGEE